MQHSRVSGRLRLNKVYTGTVHFIRDRVISTCPKNEDFRLSAPARPCDAPAAPRPKDENLHFRYHSSLNLVVQYDCISM